MLWLVVTYPFGMGPVLYCCQRNWLPWEVYSAIYKPFKMLLGDDLFHATYLWHWGAWWRDLGREHDRADLARQVLEAEAIQSAEETSSPTVSE